MLKKKWLEIRVIKKKKLLIEITKKEIVEKTQKLEAKYNEVIRVIEEMKKARVKILRNIRWQIKNKLVLKDIKV